MRTVTELALTFVFNAVWQVALIGIFAVASACLLRRITARYRHLLWVAALLLSLMLPALSCLSLLIAFKQANQAGNAKTLAKTSTDTTARLIPFEPVTVTFARLNEPAP